MPSLPLPMFHFCCHSISVLAPSNVLLQVLDEESTPFQEFKNLRNLLLDNCDLTDNFHTLGLFLQNSPNLEKLTLQHCKVYCNLFSNRLC
jgi:hypothetical protein